MSRFYDTTTNECVDPELVSEQCRNSDSCHVCGKVYVFKPERYTVYMLAVGTRNGVHYNCADEETTLYWKWYKTYGSKRFINVCEQQPHKIFEVEEKDVSDPGQKK